MVTTVTDNSPQSINTSLFSLDKEVQEIKKVTDTFNDTLSGINTESGVISVNGKQGIVELTASDVDALPSSTIIPTTTSELENTSGFITSSDSITGNAASATTADKVKNALTVNGKTYDGSSAVDAGVQTVANGGTGVTTQADINKAFIGNLDTGESDVTDGTEFVSSYASNNGFSEPGHVNKPFRRKFSAVWGYIKGKISSVLGLTKDNYGGKSAKSSFLDEYVGAGGARPTYGNFVPKDASEFGGMRKDVVTSSMTDSGRPGDDGHLLTMFWDNGGRYDSQFFVSTGATPELKVRGKNNEADYGSWIDVITSNNIGSQTVAKASTAGTADYAQRLQAFAYWNSPFDYDATNGVRVYVYKIKMVSWFNSILVQTYGDINYAKCRRYVLGLWHMSNYGYNVSVTDLGGTKDVGLHVWMGTDGNVYLQAGVYWTSRISFSRLDDITDVTITKIGEARYGSNTDINGNVLFTPLDDPIVDCGAIRADKNLYGASKVLQVLKTDVLRASNIEARGKMVIPIGAPSSLEDGCIWIER